MKINKKVIGLILVGIASINITGCGKYENKCNPEYYMIGQTMIGCEDFGNTLDKRVETLLLNTNKNNEKAILNINNVGNIFEFNGEKYRYTIERFELSKENNEDGQFSDAQYGILGGINSDLNKEYDGFTETEFIKENISNDLYMEAIEMYKDYINITYDIYENYDGELNEEELMELEYHNQRYGTVKEEMIDEMSGSIIENIFSNF